MEGPEAAEVLAKLGAPVPETLYASASGGLRTVAHVDSTGMGGFFIFTSLDDAPRLIADLEGAGAVAATPQDATIVRIENGRPRYGEEITERYLVQEAGQLPASRLAKGCYLGQEIVERVRSRAQIHRLLRRVEIDSEEVPAAGTKFKVGDADAGEIVSAVLSPALGKVVAALAYVRTPMAEPGPVLSLGGAAARVT